jgi:uncharacterized membrane protein YdjX (TVP38/TMEM64 family)
MGVKRSRFMLVLALARAPRYLLLAYLGQQVGENSEAWLKSHFWYLLGLAALIGLAAWAVIRRLEQAQGYNEDGSRDISPRDASR